MSRARRRRVDSTPVRARRHGLVSSGLVALALGCSSTPAPLPISDSHPASPLASNAAPTASASAAAPPPPLPDKPRGPTVAVLPRDYDFSKNPDAIGRIAESPHHYYRFINQPFSAVVCERFRERIKDAPRVALHGDAHLEQYAVTDLGRGLTDLDDTAMGPAIVDLLRIGTSVVIAIHEKATVDASYRGHESDALAELFRGYRQGIQKPDELPPESKVDKRLEKKFRKKRIEFLESTEKSLVPFANEADEKEAAELHRLYEERMLQTNMYGPKNKDFPASMFMTKKAGTIKIGIGSALDERFVFRLEGRTKSADDDLILELKRERTPADATCLEPLRDYNPRRYLVGPVHEDHFSPIEVPGKPFWAGEWYVNYKEVRLDKTIESLDDLKEVVFEAGYVLGRGHVLSLIQMTEHSPPVPETAIAAKKSLMPDEAFETAVDTGSITLAGEVEAGFQAFRAAAIGAPPH